MLNLGGIVRQRRTCLLKKRSFHFDHLVEDPISFAAWMICSAHHYSGLPWYILVPGIAFSVRLCASPLLTKQQKLSQQYLAPLAPLMSKVYAETNDELEKAQTLAEKKTAVVKWMKQRRAVLKQCEIGHFRRNVFRYTYLPIVIVNIMGLRAAVTMDPSFAVEGALWFPSLCDHDPYLRLSVIATIISLLGIGRPPQHG